MSCPWLWYENGWDRIASSFHLAGQVRCLVNARMGVFEEAGDDNNNILPLSLSLWHSLYEAVGPCYANANANDR